jgi:ArsR family transcriptional regulator, lead/cadmium/zinc/bismuth-responsive transcriptional repressor
MKTDRCETIFIHEDKVDLIKSNLLENKTLFKVSNFFKVLGDPTRIKILYALEKTELCVCDLSVVLDMTQSAISHQLKVLRDSDLVRSRKEGKVVFYHLADHHVHMIFKEGIEHVGESHEKNI